MAAKKFIGKKEQKLSSQADFNELHDAHIPVSLRDPVLKMSADSAIIGNIPTIFVGVVDEQYTDAMWTKHAERLSHLFGIDDPTCIAEIKVKNRGPRTIDGEQLGRDMTAAINVMNSLEASAIRIVGMGIHSALGVHDALESLVRGWNLPWEQKMVQFVALGDSREGDYLNFCKALCLKKLCGSIQFYKTMDYNNFGFLDLNRNLANLSPEKLQEILADLNVAKQQNTE